MVEYVGMHPVVNVKQLVYQAGKIDFADKDKSAKELAGYVKSRLELKLDEATLDKLSKVIADRLSNRIGQEEFKKLQKVAVRDQRTAQALTQQDKEIAWKTK